MARVTLVEKETAHPMVRELYEKNMERGGRVINLWNALGHLPYIGLSYQRMGNSILKGEELSARLRELVVLRVGQLDRCRYETHDRRERARRLAHGSEAEQRTHGSSPPQAAWERERTRISTGNANDADDPAGQAAARR